MTWRPWVIVTFGLLAAMMSGALLVTEQIPRVDRIDETHGAYDKQLRALQYIPNQRRFNFQQFGMSYELAEKTAGQIARFEKQRERFAAALAAQAADVGGAFCPSEDLPQPYAALAYLVEQENGVRRVTDWSSLRRFDPQPWFQGATVQQLYDKFERAESHRSEATLMAVSAELLGKEGPAMTGESPWATGFTGTFGFSRLVSQEPRVEQLAIEYFSLMHFLTEIANAPGGICS